MQAMMKVSALAVFESQIDWLAAQHAQGVHRMGGMKQKSSS